MESKYNPIQFSSLSLGSITAIIAIVVLTIVGELNGGFKASLASMTGHHWVSKGIVALGIFIVTWLASAAGLKDETKEKVRAWALATVGVTFLGIVALFVFFIEHFLGR